jgi:hypothetical protein
MTIDKMPNVIVKYVFDDYLADIDFFFYGFRAFFSLGKHPGKHPGNEDKKDSEKYAFCQGKWLF